MALEKKNCRDPGLNQGPLDLQSNALPAELGLGENRLTEGVKEEKGKKREKKKKRGEKEGERRKKGGKEFSSCSCMVSNPDINQKYFLCSIK